MAKQQTRVELRYITQLRMVRAKTLLNACSIVKWMLFVLIQIGIIFISYWIRPKIHLIKKEDLKKIFYEL